MKFTERDVKAAMAELAMLRYFPADEAARGAIGKLIAKMVPSLEALRWLIDTMCNEVGEWQGPKELRAVLCRRYTPADGVMVGAGPAEPTKEQVEAEVGAARNRYIEKQQAENDENLAQWKAQAALNPGEYKPFLLPAPAVKRIAPPKERVTASAGPSIAELEAQLERDMANVPTPSDEERERRSAELRAAVASRRNA